MTEMSGVALLAYLAEAVKERQHGPQRRMWYSAAAGNGGHNAKRVKRDTERNAQSVKGEME
ncbi:MAG TPA: hypothetical protein VFM05_00255 [Candidatus Saccharimonadales bacterium]|nr:hypothetical protein [Candidatus Saccharimonadales bacterium]